VSETRRADPLGDGPQPSQQLQRFLATDAGRRLLSLLIEYFHARLEGLEHLPRQGGALVVGNHALFALDTAVLGALVVRDLGRHPRFLSDQNLWRIPGFRNLIAAIGALPGEPNSAQALLRRGELVITYPGGVDDSLKTDAQRYRLIWKDRMGFARVALRARVPIVPVVGLGIDEMYSVLGHERWLGRRLFGSARYDLPIAFGLFGTILPRRVAQRYVALPPIEPIGDPDSKADVMRVRDQTRDALDAWLALERQRVAPRDR
jgi:1-acyl-sn-glycerol-3-phosphate acyltransferase